MIRNAILTIAAMCSIFTKCHAEGLTYADHKRTNKVMKRAALMLAVLALLLGGVGQARAEMVYNLVDYPASENGWTVSGQITTDGTFGSIGVNDFVSESFTISNGSVTYTVPIGTSHDLLNFIASSSSLTVPIGDFTELAGDTISGSKYVTLVWENIDLNPYPGYYAVVYPASGGQGTFLFENYNPTTSAGSIGSNDPWVIATAAVPEPSGMIFLVTAIGTIGFASWVHRRRGASEPAA
jgi:hypothetical protein